MEWIKLQHPFTCLVAGPTGSGKTVWVRRLLKNYRNLTTISATQLKVIYCYGVYQSGLRDDLDNVKIETMSGLVSESRLEHDRPHVIVIDDLMTELGGSEELSTLFTKKSHHMGLSVILIVQNIFPRGREMRTVSLNAQYIVAMKNPRGEQQVQVLGKQLYPKNAKYFIECYHDATDGTDFGYLFVDLSPRTPGDVRLRTKLFPEENIKGLFQPIVYQPR